MKENSPQLTLKEVEVAKLNLQPGDILAVTLKSEDADEELLQQLSQNFKKVFPKNKVLFFGVGVNDDVKFQIVNESDQQQASYCSNCNCGKKEGCGE